MTMAAQVTAENQVQKLLKNHQKTVPVLPFFPVIGGLPIASDQKKAFLEFFSKGTGNNIPNAASTNNKQQSILAGIDGFGYGQFVAYGPGFNTTRADLSCIRVNTLEACHYALLTGLHKYIDNFNTSVASITGADESNEFFDKYFELFVEFVQSNSQSNPSFSKDDIKDGISFVNIWDVSLNKALSSFLKCYNGCFTNGCMCLFVDLDEDVPKLHQPPTSSTDISKQPLDFDGSRSQEMMWRSRLHYLLHSCKILSQDKNDDRSNFCSIIANYSGRDDKLEKDLMEECQHAAMQIGVDSCVNYEPVLFNSKSQDSQKIVSKQFKTLMLKQKMRNIPLSWIFLRGVLDVMGTKEMIITDIAFRKLAGSSLFTFEKDEFDDFCEFFSSFGSIFYIEKSKYSSSAHIVIKPIEFIKKLDNLFSSPAPRESDNELIKYGIVTEEAASHFLGGDQEVTSFLTVLQSVYFAIKLDTSQVDVKITGTDLDADTRGKHYYYIPSVRNGKPINMLSDHAIHFCIDIMSPILSIDVAIIAKLFSNGLDAHLLLTQKINATSIRIKPSGALLNITCQGDVIEFKITDTVNEDDIEEVCSHIISACEAVVKDLSANKKHIIKYNFQVLCKNDKYAEIPYNIYHLQHTLPDHYLCHDCFKGGILDHEVRAWNKALQKKPIDDTYLLKKGITEAEISTLSKELAYYPLIALDAFASELHVQFPHEHFMKTTESEKSKIVEKMISSWLKTEHELDSTSIKTELAKKLMKLHNVFEKQLKNYPDIKFNVLARRLDIQVCSHKQFNEWMEWMMSLSGNFESRNDPSSGDSPETSLRPDIVPNGGPDSLSMNTENINPPPQASETTSNSAVNDSCEREKQFSICDLDNIVYQLEQDHFVHTEWQRLGLQLGLMDPTLENIDKQYQNDGPKMCLQKTLAAWLNGMDKVQEKGEQSWSSLAVGMDRIGHGHIASKLRQMKDHQRE